METNDEIARGVERLRGELEELQVQEREEGVTVGSKWAQQEASYRELKAVAKLRDGFAEARGAGATIEEGEILAAIDRELEGVPGCFPDDVSEAFAEGFLDGAGEIFDRV